MANDWERLWAKVDASGDCWEWTASVDRWGYGKFWFRGIHTQAHRAAWTLLMGDIPPKMTVHHLCYNRGCVNPDHLALMTQGSNAANKRYEYNSTKTHCKQGHPYNEENTYWRPGRYGRECRACSRERHRASH